MTTEIEAMLAEDERTDAINMAMDTIGLRHVSASQISQYQRCPRQWAFRQVLHMKSPPDGGLVRGSGVHHAAEVGMTHKMETGRNPEPEMAATAAAEYVTEQCKSGEIVLSDGQTQGHITDDAVRIAEAWATEAAPLVDPIAVEEQFDVLMHGIKVTGRMDVVTTGRVVDWKTSGKSPSRDDAVQSTQTSLYARATGKPVQYVYLVNQVKGVKVVDIPVSEDESRQAAALADSTVADVAQGMALGVWPRHRNGWHCSQRWCGYYERCMSGRDDAELLDRAAEARGAAGVMW